MGSIDTYENLRSMSYWLLFTPTVFEISREASTLVTELATNTVFTVRFTGLVVPVSSFICCIKWKSIVYVRPWVVRLTSSSPDWWEAYKENNQIKLSVNFTNNSFLKSSLGLLKIFRKDNINYPLIYFRLFEPLHTYSRNKFMEKSPY